MKILYGIQCTGNGHITRSVKIISKLKKIGHEVDILLSGKNSTMSIPFEVKWRMTGFTFFNSKSGGIDYLKTLTSFKFLEFLKDIKIDLSSYDKVITDFEPITAWAAKKSGVLSYGLSNQYSFLSNKTPRYGRNLIGENILKYTAPVDIPIGLHYDNYDDFIYKPIINNDIIEFKTNDYGHYTVYLPYYNLNKIVTELVNFNEQFHIFHGGVKSLHKYKNCLIYPIDKNIFVNSFINCHGIIANAGFQTTSEAMYMSKKLMAIPVKGQYEQENNIAALKKLGIFTGELTDISNFLNSEGINFEKWIDPSDEIIKYILG